MTPVATAGNVAWTASNIPAWLAFRRAVQNPAAAQVRVLGSIIGQNAASAFGQEHCFNTIRTYDQFAARVPPRDYDQFVPWIDRIRNGESAVLTAALVKRLTTTGGSSGGRKLIPYTNRLQAEFNRAIGPWIVDLFCGYPALMAGPAYWSISPVVKDPEEQSGVPIGFEEDSEYLGGIRRHLVDAAMAVPASVRHAATIDQWSARTLGYLCRCRDLRLISVWHPSFLSMLLDRLPDPPATLWPHLSVISCWTDGHSALAARSLTDRLPGVAVQPKGLIATEGIVSIPFAGGWPIAVRSHFYEFIADDQSISLVHQLKHGQSYEVMLTTSGGLYRYRLQDIVRVDGFVGRTPSIRFVGRSVRGSDRFGEKLTEAFVGRILRNLSDASGGWAFAMLAPDGDGYTLFIEGPAQTDLVGKLDYALRTNPQYAYCRDLGQLAAPRVFVISSNASADFNARMSDRNRLGDIKPVALSDRVDWANCFHGSYPW